MYPTKGIGKLEEEIGKKLRRKRERWVFGFRLAPPFLALSRAGSLSY